ncbi:MAG: hypothetical protein NC548_37965 [Lachnospiraceae bacterium]|nr:hypothetical protein [Lachnospiraceae bacterium]
MDRIKQAELIRKRNLELTQRLDEIKKQLEQEKCSNEYKNKRTDDLIFELESIQKEWIESLNDINNQRDELYSLINDVKEIKNILTNTVFKLEN